MFVLLSRCLPVRVCVSVLYTFTACLGGSICSCHLWIFTVCGQRLDRQGLRCFLDFYQWASSLFESHLLDC